MTALGVLTVLFGALLLVPANASGTESPAIARYSLPGGLRLLVREDPESPVVAVSLQIRSGSRYETPATSGVSNFVQRVMIRGTTKRSARQIVEVTEDIGGSVDASADVESAEVRGAALATHREALLELIADVVLNPAFPPDEVARERRLILSQIQTRAETPFALAFETLTAQLFGSHPYALPPIGHRSSVERLGREDLVAHYRQVYRAGGTVLVVSGGVERESVRRQVERLFAKLPKGGDEVPGEPPSPEPSAHRRVLERPVQQAQVLMGFLGPGIGEPDYAPGKVMSAVLGGGIAGRLYVRLRDERGLAYSLGTINPSRRRPGLFVAYMGTAGDTADVAEAGMRQEIERFRIEGPTDAELARAKAYVLGTMAMDRRTNARQAWYLAAYELLGVGWDYPDRHARAVSEVTRADVARVAQRYLTQPTTVVLRPRP